MDEVDEAEVVRHEAVTRLALLDAPRQERFERIVRLACRMFGVPTALVTLIDDTRQFHVAEVGFGVREIPRSQSFCDYAVHSNELLVVEDAQLDPRFRDNALVTGPESVRFYAGQPISSPSGVPVGALCIVDRRPRTMTGDQLQMLQELAAIVQDELAHSEEFDRAREVQLRLLPQSKPDLSGYEVAGACQAAGQVGGDFFDWYRLDDQFQFVVADVMGKGVGAGLIGAGVRAVLRGCSRYNDLESSVRRLAQSVEPDLGDTASFVTMFAGRLDPASHILAYVDAGHGIAGIVTAAGEAKMLISDGMPLGIVGGPPWQAHEVRIEPGDTFVCLSDGLLDMFPSLEAAQEAIRFTVVESADVQQVVDTAVAYGLRHHATDDVTVLALQRIRT